MESWGGTEKFSLLYQLNVQMYNVPTLFGNLQHRSLTCKSPPGNLQHRTLTCKSPPGNRQHRSLTCKSPPGNLQHRSLTCKSPPGNLQHRSLTYKSPGGRDRKSLTNFYNIMLYRVHLALAVFELTRLVVIGNDCT